MNHPEPFPGYADLLMAFLAKAVRSVVFLRLSPSGQVLQANAPFRELFPDWEEGDDRRLSDFLEPLPPTEDPANLGAQTYRLCSALVPGARLQGIRIAEGEGSLLIGERILPASEEAVAFLTSTTAELARLNRDLQKRLVLGRRSEQAIRQRHRGLWDALPLGALLLDEQLQVVEANPAALRLLGGDPRRLLDGVLDEDECPLAPMAHPAHLALTRGLHVEGSLLGLGDGSRWFLVEAIPMPETSPDEPGRVCVTFMDVTERRRMSRDLRDREARLTAIFQTSYDGIALTDLATGTYLDVNPAFERITGFPRGEVLGRTPVDLLKADPGIRMQLVHELKRAGHLERFPIVVQRKDGQLVQAEMNLALAEVQGRPCIVSVSRDRTEALAAEEKQQQLEAQLRQAQKLESLGSLAGGVAHDMNNVLAAIQGLAAVHRAQAAPGSPLARAMETITRACERGGKLVKGLLGFARRELAEVKEVDLNAVVGEEAALLERTTFQRVRLKLDLQPDLPPVRGDAAALGHALMNLCINAVDAMPNGGDLILRTHAQRGEVTLTVEDTGEGMPPDVLQRALDPFFTTKPVGKGTGLGLSMVFGTVRAHGGSLNLESTPGIGTRVHLRLPAMTSDAPVSVPSDEQTPASPGRRILLVDDDELILQTWQQLAALTPHHVTMAASGEQALEMLRTESLPDVVVLDWNMPGIGGSETLRRTRTLHPELPVVVSSGGAAPELPAVLELNRRVVYIQKPFTWIELEQAFRGLGL